MCMCPHPRGSRSWSCRRICRRLWICICLFYQQNHTETVLFTIHPISFIKVTCRHLQHPMSVLRIPLPLANVRIAIWVLVRALTWPLSLHPVAFIHVLIRVLHNPVTLLPILNPFAFVLATSLVMIHALAVLFAVQEVAYNVLLIVLPSYTSLFTYVMMPWLQALSSTHWPL